MGAIFLEGNSRDVLRNLPADYFHCAMTSPPYFGLRAYKGGSEIWDGDSDCSHIWGAEMVRRDRGTAKGENAVVGNQLREVSGVQTVQGNFCQLCGAWKGALGNEPTPELYLRHLVEICREVRRVLRPDGVFWLNIGDSWAGSGKGQMGDGSAWAATHDCKQSTVTGSIVGGLSKGYSGNGIKPLDMVLIPEQLALALRADGWWLRSILIWAKGVSLSDSYNGNPMPESVNGWRFEKCRVKVGNRGRSSRPVGPNTGSNNKEPYQGNNPHLLRLKQEAWRLETGQQDHDDKGGFLQDAIWQDCPGCPKCEKNSGYVLRKGSWRPTDSFEYVLMLTKTNSYYCDREAVLERGVYPAGESRSGGNGHKSLDAGSRTTEGLHNKEWVGNGGRNLRSVLAVPTRGFPGAHFATYPPQLIEPLIKTATSEKGCCPKCGSPWARVLDKSTNGNRTGELNYDSKYKVGGVTGLATQGFQRNETIEAERERSREEAKSLFPNDERKQQDYINHIHDHGGLDKGRTVGWLPTCTCGVQETEPCRVLDMFAGAGTTALVAERLGLDSIGIDTSAEYIQLAEARIVEDEQKRIDDQIKQLRKEAKAANQKGVK